MGQVIGRLVVSISISKIKHAFTAKQQHLSSIGAVCVCKKYDLRVRRILINLSYNNGTHTLEILELT